MRSYPAVWFGRLLSMVGTPLTGFGVSVWVYQTTGSATMFALILLFTVVPGILISPLAGPLVDRWDRRKSMVLADTGAGGFAVIRRGGVRQRQVAWAAGSSRTRASNPP